MKRVVVITLKISAVLALVGYAIFQRQVVDLRGVFSIDKNFRSTTKYLVIHHDNIWRKNSVKEIEDYHRDTCGYTQTGFAYNIYISGGRVYIIHNLDAYNAATKGYNSNTIAICIHSEDKTKLSSQIALILTIRYLMFRYDIPKDRVVGHCDLNPKTVCPEIDFKLLRKWL